MNTVTALLLLFILLQSDTLAQSKGSNGFICVGGKSFTAGELAPRVFRDYYTITYEAQFSVKMGKATNVRIVHADSAESSTQVLDEETKTNFSRIAFLRDTAEARIRMTYVFAPSMDISGDFAEVVSPNEVRFFFRHIFNSTSDPAVWIRGDSVTTFAWLCTEDSIVAPSDILVERIFHDRSDTSIIVKSNNPWLNSGILSDAGWYKLEYLRSGNPDAKYFFIRYRLTRCTQDDCGVIPKRY